jgi:hypothetical protein
MGARSRRQGHPLGCAGLGRDEVEGQVSCGEPDNHRLHDPEARLVQAGAGSHHAQRTTSRRAGVSSSWPPLCAWGGHVVAHRIQRGLSPRGQPELGEHAGHVALHGAQSQPERGSICLFGRPPAMRRSTSGFAGGEGRRRSPRAWAPAASQTPRNCLVQHESPASSRFAPRHKVLLHLTS